MERSMNPEDYDEGQQQRQAQGPHLAAALSANLRQLRRLNVGVARCRQLSLAISDLESCILRVHESYDPTLEDDGG